MAITSQCTRIHWMLSDVARLGALMNECARVKDIQDRGSLVRFCHHKRSVNGVVKRFVFEGTF